MNKHLLSFFILLISIQAVGQSKRLVSKAEIFFWSGGQKWEVLDSIHYYYTDNSIFEDSTVTYRNHNHFDTLPNEFKSVIKQVTTHEGDQTIRTRIHRIGPNSSEWRNAYRDIVYGNTKKPYKDENYFYRNNQWEKVSESNHTYINGKKTYTKYYASFLSTERYDSSYFIYEYNTKGQLINEERYTWIQKKNGYVGSNKKTYVYKGGNLDTMFNHNNGNSNPGEPEWYISTYNAFEYLNDGLLVNEYITNYLTDKQYITYRYRYEYVEDKTSNGSSNNQAIAHDTIIPIKPLAMFPNPALSYVSFNRDSAESITIYDASGQLVADWSNLNQRTSIRLNIHQLAAGVYVVVFNNKATRREFKLIKV